MACKNVCRLCNRLVLSQAITFTAGADGAPGTLTVNLPAGSYQNNEKYCIVLAQTIPTDTTISANVVFTIGAGTEEYPLVNRCYRPVTACGVRTRTKYSVTVQTTATGANFRMLGNPLCMPNNDLTAVDGTAPTTTTPATGA